jgi:spore coat protein A
VTRIKTKFRIHTGLYMYHCHILEHEDMEMMRPLLVQPSRMPEMAHGGHAHTNEHTHTGG